MSLTSTNSLRVIGGGASGAASDLTGTTLASNVVNSSLKTINSSMTSSEKLSFLQSLGQYKREVFDFNTPGSLTCPNGTTLWESLPSNLSTLASQCELTLPTQSAYFTGQYIIVSDSGYNITYGGSFEINCPSGEDYIGPIVLRNPGSYAIFTPGTDVSLGTWLCVGGSSDVEQQIIESMTGLTSSHALNAKLANQGDNNYITGIDWQRQVTIDIATSTLTWIDNITTPTTFNNGDVVYLSGAGTVPTGISIYIKYYTVSVDNTAKTFKLSKTSGGAAISLSGSQTGTFYIHKPIQLGATTITGALMNDGDYTGQTLILQDGKFNRSITFGVDTSAVSYMLNNIGNLKMTAADSFQIWGQCGSNYGSNEGIILRTFNAGNISLSPYPGGRVAVNPIGSIAYDASFITGKSAGVGGVIKVDTTTNSNSGSGVTNLTSFSVVANSLGTNGDFLEFEAWGVFAANGNNKQLIALFGSTTLIDSTSLAFNGLSWKITGKIVRTGATTQTATTQLTISGTLLGSVTTTTVSTSSPAETLANALTLKCTGQGTSSTDISQNGLIVKWMPRM